MKCTKILMKISLATLSIAVYDFWRGIPCKMFNENIFNNTVYHSLWFWRGIPCRLPPFCVGMPLCPGCHLVLVLLLMLILLVQWSEGIKPPFSWQQGSSLFEWRVLCIREKDIGSSVNLTWRGTYPLLPIFWSCKPWLSSMSSCVGH